LAFQRNFDTLLHHTPGKIGISTQLVEFR